MSEGEIEEENERGYREGREGREGGVSQHYKLPRASLTHALWNLSSGRGGGHHFIITPPPLSLINSLVLMTIDRLAITLMTLQSGGGGR